MRPIRSITSATRSEQTNSTKSPYKDTAESLALNRPEGDNGQWHRAILQECGLSLESPGFPARMAGIKHHQVFDQNREQQELTGAEAINTVESVHSQTDVCCVTSKKQTTNHDPQGS